MKKIILSTVMTIFLITLAGCSKQSFQTETPELTQNTATNVPTKNQNISSENAGSITENSMTTINFDNYDFSSYEKQIDDITKEINNSSATSDIQANRNTFFQFKKKLDAIENDLDNLEDAFEHSYKSGQMPLEKYKSLEISIEKLEDRIESIEKALENKFNIDD